MKRIVAMPRKPPGESGAISGLETFIIDESHLVHALDLESRRERIWSLKLSIFDIVPAHYDRVMYFDNDWRPVRDWNVDLHFPDRSAIYVAPDRNYLDVIRALEIANGHRGTYFNAGWMIIPRSARSFIEESRRRYADLPKRFADQCVLNQVLDGKVTHVPAAFNVMDLKSWPDPASVMAVHSTTGKWNYEVYRGETEDRDWQVVKYDDPNETILRNLDYSHRWTLDVEHIVELYQVASGYAGGSALDVRSFRGHCALALALAGLRVTSIDASSKHRRDREGMLSRYFRDACFRIEHSTDQLETPGRYDVVLYDAEPNDRKRPEIEDFGTGKSNLAVC